MQMHTDILAKFEGVYCKFGRFGTSSIVMLYSAFANAHGFVLDQYHSIALSVMLCVASTMKEGFPIDLKFSPTHRKWTGVLDQFIIEHKNP